MKKFGIVRILLVSMILGGFAGDSGQMWHIINGLKKRGHSVDVFVTDGDAWFYDSVKSEKYKTVRKKLFNTNGTPVEINGVNVIASHSNSDKFGFYSRNLKKIGKQLIKNYDLVYAIHWYNFPVMEMSKIAYENGVPFVMAAYGSLQKTARLINYRWGKKFLDLMYTKKLIKNATSFHSVGELETQEYLKLGIEKERIFRIDHGIVLDDFKIKERHEILKKIGIDEKNDKYLIFVGKLNNKKGVDILLKSFSNIVKKHENLFLVIVGSGAKDYENELKKLMQTLDLDSKVKFTGWLKESEKLELLEKASIFVTPSHSDVHSIAIQEALVMGVPVIVSKESDWPEIDEYNAGKTIDVNTNSVYEAIESLLDDKTNLKELSSNAKKLIEEKFLMEKIIIKYEDEFKKIINSHEK
jgi:glycosyltransferase involved in cell wall biosynthesis